MPVWLAQFELVKLIIKDKKLELGRYANLCKDLAMIRKYHELEFKELNACDRRNSNCFLIILKKVGREDLIKFKNKFRRGSFIYKIK